MRSKLHFFGCRSIGDWSATAIPKNRDCLQPLQLVGDQSPTSRRPVANLSATPNNLAAIDLVAERFYLQQPKPPCDQIVPATICNRSATSRWPPCNHPATSLRPPEILVARRSPTGCKLCVTGALVKRATGVLHAWIFHTPYNAMLIGGTGLGPDHTNLRFPIVKVQQTCDYLIIINSP